MNKHVTTNVDREKHKKEKEEKKKKVMKETEWGKMITTQDIEMLKRKQEEDALSNVIEIRNEELDDYNKALNENETEQKKKNENT